MMSSPSDGLFMGFETLQTDDTHLKNLSDDNDEFKDAVDTLEDKEKNLNTSEEKMDFNDSDENNSIKTTSTPNSSTLNIDQNILNKEDTEEEIKDRSHNENEDDSKLEESTVKIDEKIEEKPSISENDELAKDTEISKTNDESNNENNHEQEPSKENEDDDDNNKENEHDTSEEMDVNTSVEEESSEPKAEESKEKESKLVIRIGPAPTLKEDDPQVDDDSDEDKMVIDEDVSEQVKQINEGKVKGAKKRKQKFVSRVVDDELDVTEDHPENVDHEDLAVGDDDDDDDDDDNADYVICPLTGEHIQKVIPTAVEIEDKEDPGDEIGEDNYSDDDYCPTMDDRVLTVHPKKNKKKRRSVSSGKPVDLKTPGLFKSKAHREFSKEELDAFAVPFTLGWGREIVVRNATDSSKKQMDTYYFNPAGKKLRSMVQVNDFLVKSNDSTLKSKNFTFSRVPVYKEPFEVIRNAGKSKVGSPLVQGRKKSSNNLESNDKTPTGNAKVKTPNEKGKTPKSSEKNSSKNIFKPKLPPNKKFKSEAVRRAEKSDLILKRRADESIDNGEKPTKIIKVDGRKIMSSDLLRPCSLQCPGMEDIPPSLQCNICICLFHPKCVKCLPQMAGFVCPKCQLGNKQQMSTSNVIRLPKLQPKVINPATPIVSQVLPPLPKLRPMTAVAQVKAQHITGPPPLQRAGAKETIQSSIAIVKSGLQQPVMDTKGGQLLTLPPHVISKLNLKEPLALKINGQPLTVNPSCFVQTPEGMKIFLPAKTLPATPSNKTINVNLPPTTRLEIKSYNDGLTTQIPTLHKTIVPTPELPTSTSDTNMSTVVKNSSSNTTLSYPTSSVWDSSKPTDSNTEKPVIDKDIKPLLCFVNKLDSGFDCMLQIFSYLSIPDLLRTSRVCKRWRRIAIEPTLWRTVMLKDCHVFDWEVAATFLERMQTQTLDLRGAHHADDRNRTWHQMTAVLEQLRFIKCFHFGQCPASILHAVSLKLVNLKVLTAEWITDVFTEPQMWSTVTKLDMGKFSNLINLEELRLRGICGLVLPQLTNTIGMNQLSALRQLRKLSMTTLKDIPSSEFGFIASLTNLEELEIGDCDSWTAETYQCLSKLTRLKRLRLENGGCHPDLGLADGLRMMKQLEQLQLMVFQLPDTLAQVLPGMSNLKRLSLWPDTRSQAAVMNTNAMNAVKDLKTLKFLEWCTMKNNDEVSGADAKSVPFVVEGSNSVQNIQLKSAKELASTLKGHLPKTRIRVARLPVVSHLKKPDV